MPTYSITEDDLGVMRYAADTLRDANYDDAPSLLDDIVERCATQESVECREACHGAHLEALAKLAIVRAETRAAWTAIRWLKADMWLVARKAAEDLGREVGEPIDPTLSPGLGADIEMIVAAFREDYDWMCHELADMAAAEHAEVSA